MTEPTWRETGDDGAWRGEEHAEEPYAAARDPQWESKEEQPPADGPSDDEGTE